MYEIVDMRVQNWSVPPQEMITRFVIIFIFMYFSI